jgi:hypothetical protein
MLRAGCEVLNLRALDWLAVTGPQSPVTAPTYDPQPGVASGNDRLATPAVYRLDGVA